MDLWTPKIGDFVTTELYLNAGSPGKVQIKGRIKEIRPVTPTTLPIRVDGFWFTPEELTHRPDLAP